MRNEIAPITVAVWRPPSYKYLIRSPPRTISHFFPLSLPCLGFPSPDLSFSTMEGKRGIKRERSPSAKGSPAASDAKTPPSVPSGTPSTPGSPAEVCSHHPRSPVLEQGGSSGTAPVVDLSSPQGEENPLHDIARDFEFAQRLCGELNRAFLVHPAMVKSSSSVTPTKKKRRRARRILSVPTMRLLLLQSTRSQPPPPMTMTLQLRSLRLQLPLLPMPITTLGWGQMIVVTVWPRVQRWRRAPTEKTKPTHLSLPHQERHPW
jgi:hypothetical protein